MTKDMFLVTATVIYPCVHSHMHRQKVAHNWLYIVQKRKIKKVQSLRKAAGV